MSANALAPAQIDSEPSPLPTGLDSPRSKLVYLRLSLAGRSGRTIDDLQADLGLTKLSLYPVLDGLATRGFVEREGETYRVVA